MTSTAALRLARDNALLVLVLCVFVALTLVSLPYGIGADTWLAFLCGRLISEHGLPSHDTLTVLAHGRQWVDQQWLAQWLMYRVQQVGGLRGVATLHAGLACGATAGAVAVARARARGAKVESTALILLVAGPSLVIDMWSIRTQSFAFPLFVTVAWLVLSDVDRPTRRIWWALPTIVVWANMHGSVVLGVGLLGLRGLFDIRRDARRAGLLVLASVAGLFATPYVLHLPTYYVHTLLNPQFAKYVTEWQPPAPGLTTAPFLLLAAWTLWLVGRVRPPRFDVALLLLFGLNGMLALRNLTWFALIAIMLVPTMVDTAERTQRPAPVRTPRTVAIFLSVGALLVAGALATTIARSDFTPTYSRGASAAITAAITADPTARIYADEPAADWVLFEHPQTIGRVLFDARFELLHKSELVRILRFHAESGDTWRSITDGAHILVINTHTGLPHSELEPAPDALSRNPGAHVVFRDNHLAVLVRPPA